MLRFVSRSQLSQNYQVLPLFRLGSLLMPAQPLRETLLYQLAQQPHTDWHTVTTLFQHNYRLIPQMAHWCRQRPKCLSVQSEVVTGSGGVRGREILPYYLYFFQPNKITSLCQGRAFHTECHVLSLSLIFYIDSVSLFPVWVFLVFPLNCLVLIIILLYYFFEKSRSVFVFSFTKFQNCKMSVLVQE